LPGCSGSPAADASAAMAKPVVRAQELAAEFLGPPTLTQAASSLRTALAGIGEEPRRLQHMGTAAERLVAIDRDRLPDLVSDLKTMPGRELDRLGRLDPAPLTDELDPQRFGHNLNRAADRMPRLLWLDRRPMEEHDDDRHRTDPDDLHPETSLWRRVLRRLGM